MQYCRVRYEPGADPNGKEVHSRPVYKRSADSVSPKVLSMRVQAKMVRKNAVWNCTPRTGTDSAPSSSIKYLCVYAMLKLPQVLQSRLRKLNCSLRRIVTAARMEALRRRTGGLLQVLPTRPNDWFFSPSVKYSRSLHPARREGEANTQESAHLHLEMLRKVVVAGLCFARDDSA